MATNNLVPLNPLPSSSQDTLPSTPTNHSDHTISVPSTTHYKGIPQNANTTIEHIHVPLSKEEQSRLNKRRIRRTLAITFLIDAGIPLIIYFILEHYISLVWALFCAGIPPLIGAIYKFIRTRKLDLLGVVIVIGVVISLVLTIITSDPVFLLLRESVMTGFKGLVDLLSLIPLSFRNFTLRPLMFYVARVLLPHAPVILPDGSQVIWYDYCWMNMPRFRRHWRLITLVWGIGLMLEFGARLVMIFFIKDVNKVVVLSTAIISVWIGLLSIMTFQWGKILQKQADEDFINLGLDGREAKPDEWTLEGW